MSSLLSVICPFYFRLLFFRFLFIQLFCFLICSEFGSIIDIFLSKSCEGLFGILNTDSWLKLKTKFWTLQEASLPNVCCGTSLTCWLFYPSVLTLNWLIVQCYHWEGKIYVFNRFLDCMYSRMYEQVVMNTSHSAISETCIPLTIKKKSFKVIC